MTAQERPGLAQAEENRDPWSWYPAKAAMLQIAAETAASGGVFEAFDLTDRYGVVLDDSSRWGPLFASAARDGLIEHAGFAVARRPSRSGGITRTWRGTAKARAYGGDQAA